MVVGSNPTWSIFFAKQVVGIFFFIFFLIYSFLIGICHEKCACTIYNEQKQYAQLTEGFSFFSDCTNRHRFLISSAVASPHAAHLILQSLSTKYT